MNDAIRSRIEAQGFLGLDDRMIGRLNYWLRLSPAICMIWAAIGTALESSPVLWALAPFALLGGVATRPSLRSPLQIRRTTIDERATYSTQSTSAKVCLPTRYGYDCDSRMEFSIRTDVVRSDPWLGTGYRSVCER